jgi:formate hydrogenlyase subunit 6/NADH:ubiquinone oxidoreductase subunit I
MEYIHADKIMSMDEAIELLASKGIRVYKIDKKVCHICEQGDELKTQYKVINGKLVEVADWTYRDIIQYAKSYSSNSVNQNVKKFSNDKDRSSTRDAIKKQNFEKIPQKRRTKEEDRWSWD